MKHIKLFLLVVLISNTSCLTSRLLTYGVNQTTPEKIPEFTKEYVLLGEHGDLRACFDVYFYDLTITPFIDEKSLLGKVEIHAQALVDFQRIQLDLHPNLQIKKLGLKDGDNLKYSREERAVLVELEKKKGDDFIIIIEYDGKPIIAKKPPWNGGFVWKKDNEGKPWIGVACESEGASIWWPLKDHPLDEPDSMRLHYQVPKGLSAIGNGQFEGVKKGEVLDTYTWFISYPINTYNVTMYVGNFKNISTIFKSEGGEVNMTHYVLRYHYKRAEEHFKQVDNVLGVYEDYFGAYPFIRDGFRLVESPYAGMEHQSAIAYGNGYKNNLYGKLDYIILHEAAHEWWGNSVTAGDFADIWLQEGFATYAEVLYMEAMYGKSAAEGHLWIYRLFITNKHPLVGIENRRWFDSEEHGDAYTKGAWVLHTLRQQIDNDEVFFDIIKTFAQENKYGIVRTADFIELVNRKSGQDYNWFFDHYLYNRETPVLKYNISSQGEMRYWWANVDEAFNRLKVMLFIDNTEIMVTPTTKVQTVVIPNFRKKSGTSIKRADVLCNFKRLTE